jgi:DNA-binding LacI/PurR family transcriptional regulator
MTTPRNGAAERQPSLHDIAASAGVSVSTVSRYLAGQLALKADTEARVLDAITRLGYSRAPKGTKDHRTRNGVIGLVVPQVGNTYFGRIADSIVKVAERQGLSVLICSTLSHARKQLDYVDLLVSQEVSGIIYAGQYSSNRSLANVIASGRPVVVIDEALTTAPPVDSVLVDDYAGAYQATTYLTNLGHRDIALVTGPPALHSVQERTRGFEDAMRKAGNDPAKQLMLHGGFNEEFGVSVVSHLLAAATQPTAVFAASDTVALGILTAARSLGVRVPEDLSVVGFDDIPDSAVVTPALTTVRTPVDRMAGSAVELLTNRIDDPSRPVTNSVIGVALVVRDSASAPGQPTSR